MQTVEQLRELTKSTARESACRTYRYELRRTWDPALPTMLFCMLNPSTANAVINDATIRSCIRLAMANGCGSIHVINIYAVRATNPRDLVAGSVADIVGPDNAEVIEQALVDLYTNQGVFVVAWGSYSNRPPCMRVRAQRIADKALDLGVMPMCFGRNKDDSPRHPLYVPTGCALVDADARAAA